VLVPTCALRRSRGNKSSIRGEHQGTGKNWSSNSLQCPP
jgi:hypothetical protein